MQLMTKALEEQFQKIGSQEESKDPIVVCKFFDPTGSATWLATEYDPENREFFGFCSLFGLGSPEDEWGYFSLDELESIKVGFGLGIERDLYMDPQPISQIHPQALSHIN